MIRKILKASGLAVLLVLGLVVAGALTFLTEETLNDELIVIRPRLANVGANIVVYTTSSQRIVVDSQLPVLSYLTRHKVGTLNANDAIVITHWHPDHSGGYFEIQGEATTYAHHNTIGRLSSDQQGYGLTAPGSVHFFKARANETLPAGSVTKDFELDDAKVLYFPKAHTNGDLVIHFVKANVMAIGDLVWPASFPFVDTHSGGTVQGLMSALEYLIHNSDSATRFVPGHGQTLDRADLKVYLQMVQTTVATIACRSKQTNLDADLASNWGQWSSDLVPTSVWIEMTNRSLGDKTDGYCDN